MKYLILVIVLVFIPVFYLNNHRLNLTKAYAQQSDELKAAKQDLKESYEKLVEVKGNEELTQEEKERQELEAVKIALKEVIEFSITETKNLIVKLGAITNLSVKYVELQGEYLSTLKNLLSYQQNQLKNLDDPALDLAGVKKLAADFKLWRETVYGPAIKKILNFILVFQSSEVVVVAGNRFGKISTDLRLLKNSKVVKVELLRPLLDEAGNLIKEAAQFNQDAARLLIATSTPANIININNLISETIDKIKEAYGKFLEMSGLVKKMVGR